MLRLCARKCDLCLCVPGHREKVRLLNLMPRADSVSSLHITTNTNRWNCNKLSVRGCARVIKANVQQERQYHSETGVYGYRPPPVHQFTVPDAALESRINQSNFWRFVTAYRQHAHKKANINPVAISPISDVPELDPKLYGISENDRFNFTGILSSPASDGTFTDALQFLQKSYSGTMSAEFLYLEEVEEQEWFAQRMEQLSSEKIDNDKRLALATEMLKSQAFDNFLATKFVTLKRYGGEGAEGMMGFYMELLNSASKAGLDQIVCGMAHRGRLNLLTGMFNFPPEMLFRKLKGYREFSDDVKASGDIMSHFTSSVDLDIDGKLLHLTMLYNPSHLEAVNPVSMGKTRGRQQSLQDGDYSAKADSRWSDKVINLQVHGDAAFSGQGVNQETLALTTAPHFQVGGSLHLIINNQLGFTTPGNRGRSSRYCSDLAKMISAPVVHVNGDCPEEVIKATRLAFEYQRKFRKEVFVDLNCFRQWGHNELDDPTFTNPAQYNIINSRRTVPDMYANALIEENLMTTSDVTNIISKHSNWLDKAWKSVDDYVPEKSYFQKQWAGFSQAPAAITTWDTGVDTRLLETIGKQSVAFPEGFNIHPHLLKMYVNGRLRKVADGSSIDWATAEALAFGSLLYQGYNVRLSGQDVGRGTFSHRHVMLVDQKTNNIYIPLNSLNEAQLGKLEVANSILSEEAVLGFEYGMSIESPNNLIIWEAQFGDFFNGAQIQIDTYITSGEAKWMTCSGLVMLLPHGYDGAGPEHSSCRLERFLQLSDSTEATPDGEDVNIHVTNPTTPAQYFHLLRRQMIRNYRKPLIIVGPKTLLRLNDAASALTEMGPQTTFSPVIGDQITEPHRVQKIIFVSGKHYYALDRHRQVEGINDVAIIRLEELSPFPTQSLQQEIAKYKNAKVFIWSQEEHQNMGAWSFVKPRFENLVGRRLRYVGRTPAAAPAVGIGQLHQQEVQDIVTRPFKLH